jgi:predicted O-methyltransferase YrrM
MTASLVRLAASRDPAADPLGRALRTTLLGRVPREEREWIDRIEAKRAELMADRGLAGSPFDPAAPEGRSSGDEDGTTVALASELMSLPPPWCLLLMQLVRELAPRLCVELGTAFGISTAYQAAALELNGSGKLTTFEGSAAWGELAERNLSALGLGAVEIRVGPISETLPAALSGDGAVDFAFIDAEHQADAALEQFRIMSPRFSRGALVVLDDVNWPQMGQVHDAIGGQPEVSTSLTIGRLGLSVLGRRRSGSP